MEGLLLSIYGVWHQLIVCCHPSGANTAKKNISGFQELLNFSECSCCHIPDNDTEPGVLSTYNPLHGK